MQNIAVLNTSSGTYTTYSGAWLNTGNGWVSSPQFVPPTALEVLNHNVNSNHHNGAQLVDVNGDHLPDLVKNISILNSNGTYTPYTGAWLNTGNGWIAASQYNPPTELEVNNGNVNSNHKNGLRIVDVNGDGAVDFIKSITVGSAAYTGAWTGGNSRVDFATSITNGLGSTTSVSYQPLTNNTVYTKGSGARYPTMDLQVPMHVVSQVQTSIGGGGTFTSSYQYGGLKADLSGRGILGFNTFAMTQVETGVTTQTTYSQSWPYVGLPTKVVKTHPSASGLDHQLNVVQNTYDCSDAVVGSSCVGGPNKYYFPYLKSSVESSWDLNGAVLPVVTTTNTFDCESAPASCYGNAVTIVVGADDLYSKTTANTYSNDTTNWILGRLIRATVTSAGPAVAGPPATASSPTLTAITPNSGPVAGGTAVTLSGTNFTSDATVTIGGVAATGCSVTSATSISCTTPAGTAGAQNVVVSEAAGSATLAGGFTYEAANAPTLTSISPNYGPKTGGTAVTLTGSNFTSDAIVKIGGVAATGCTVVSSTSITCTTPAGLAGAQDVVVSEASGSATLAGGFWYGVQLLSVSPNNGPLAGGTAVTLTGTGFKSSATVKIGGIAASCTFQNSTTITCTTPANTAGAKDVVVTQSDGTATLSGGFWYGLNLLSVTPSSGSMAGGTAVTLAGYNFAANASVTIGGNAAVGCAVVNPNTITCTTPPGTLGYQDVVVSQTGESTTLVRGYRYVITLTSISPNIGPMGGGQAVALTGTGFAAGATVTFGGRAGVGCAVTNSTTMTCTTPAFSPPGNNVVDVVVSQAGMSATLAGSYTYQNAPILTGISPTNGPATGSTAITLTGSNFATGATVTIGGVSATGCTRSGSSITCTTPASSTAGAKDVVVSQPGGSSTLAGGFTYNVVLSAISPNIGPVAGGASVTLTGVGFAAGATVTFGGRAGVGCAVTNPTTMTCTTPAFSPLGNNVVDVVVTQAGVSSTLTASYTYQNAPTLTSISPTNGPATGGTAITLTGSNFATGATVTIGGVAATGCTVVSSTSLTCTTGAGTIVGVQNVVVSQPGGSATLAGGYTYNIGLTSVSPNVGPMAGGQTVSLTGGGFASGASVTFGSNAGVGCAVVNPTTITCTTPSGSAGSANVTVTQSGAGSATLLSGYTYQKAPTISGISPTSGPIAGGTAVSVSGSNFVSGATVTIGGVAATGCTLSMGRLNCTTGPGTSTGAKNVVVSEPGGSATLSNGFTYN